jgi:biotin synthase-like enzyme
VLRFANKHIKYAANKQVEVEILLHYCKQFKKQGSYLFKSIALANLYAAQLKKISKAIDGLHEDLQFEYVRTLEMLK